MAYDGMTKTSGSKVRCAACKKQYNAGKGSVPKPCPTCNPPEPKGKIKRTCT